MRTAAAIAIFTVGLLMLLAMWAAIRPDLRPMKTIYIGGSWCMGGNCKQGR